MEKMKKIYLLLILLFIGTFLPISPLMATEPKSGSCSNNCNDVKCVIGTTNGHLNVTASKNQMDSKCMAKEAAKGCFNTVPVSCAGSYAGLGYRPNGAGGNPKPRNHLGSDIGMAACKQGNKYVPVNVYAAADGIVKYVNTGGCSGRTIVIEHTKACKNANDPSYKSTYRHLLQYKVSAGQTVKKGDVIGIVGGSNAGKIGGNPCDRGEQAGWPGYTTSGCAAAKSKCGTPNYAIHLHFEVEDGKASASSSQASASKAMSPNCNNLQVLCGSCPNNAGSCGGSSGGVFSDGSSASLEGGYSETYQNGNNYSADNTCTLAKYLDAADCKFCPLFRSFFNAASSVAKSANDALAGPSRALVGLGFLIWLCIYVLKHITNFGGTSTGDMLKGILFQGFRVAVVSLILANAIYATMDLTLNPVMQTGLGFVNSLNENSKCEDDAPYMQDIMGYKSGAGDGNGGLSIDLGKSILCSIKKLEDATGFMLGLGKYSICLSTNVYNWILPHFGYWLTGAFLWLAGLLVLLTFPWCLADCILQLCVAAALTPCAIAAYAFKITEKYLKIIWNFFMNAMFNFVFLGLIIYIINSHLRDWIGMDIDDTSSFPDHIFVEGFSAKGLAVWGIGFIKVAAICFFCWTFFEEAGDIAKKFAESPGLGGSKGIAPMVGGTMGNIGQAAGAGTLKLGGKIGVGAARGAGRMANSLVGNKFRSGMNHLKGKAISILPKGKKIVDADGKTIGYERNIRFMGRNISRTYTKGEDGVWTGEKVVKKRSSADKAFEQVFDKNGNAVKDADGNNVYRYRKRIFGITTGYEEMSASKNAEGNLVYRSQSGKGNFTMDSNGNFINYKTRVTMNFDNLSTRKMSKMYDKNGFAVKDAAGNDQYEIKHRFLGVTFKKEKMEALKDENGNIIKDNDGNIVYATVDKRNSLVMDKDHNMNNVIIDRPFRTRTGEKQVKNYQAKRVINDAFSKTTQTLDNQGNVIASETHFNNESAKYLNNKDGTINKVAFNQIKNGSKNAEAAASAMVAEVMKFRGQALEHAYKNRSVEIQADGSVIIKQINNDGSKQVIHAQVIGDQMIIRNTITDENGNTTIQKSNGMQTLTEKYTRVVDESTGNSGYIYQSRLDFSDYLHQKNSHHDPLDAYGDWGHNLDAQKVMLGFTENDFRKHKAQVQLAQMRKVMGEEQYLAALNDPRTHVAKLAGLLNAGDINTYNSLRRLRNKMGAKEFEAASKDPNSDVARLKKKLIAGSLTESAARIHAAQAIAGGLDVQLSNLTSMIDSKEKLLKAIEEGKQKASAQEKQALQNEIKNLKKVEADLRQTMNTDAKTVQQPQSQPQPETPQPQPETPQPETPQQQPVRTMSYEEIINEIAGTEVTPERLVEMRAQLEQTALADRNQDHAFVYDELQKKADETIIALAAGSLAGATAEDLNKMETMLDTFVGHTTDQNGVKTYTQAGKSAAVANAANTLKSKIDQQRQAMGIAVTQPGTRSADDETRSTPSDTETGTSARTTQPTTPRSNEGQVKEDESLSKDAQEEQLKKEQEEKLKQEKLEKEKEEQLKKEQPEQAEKEETQKEEQKAAEETAKLATEQNKQDLQSQNDTFEQQQIKEANAADSRAGQDIQEESEANAGAGGARPTSYNVDTRGEGLQPRGQKTKEIKTDAQQLIDNYDKATKLHSDSYDHYKTAAKHYDAAAMDEKLAEDERKLAAAGGPDAERHIKAAVDAEARAEVARQAAFTEMQKAEEARKEALNLEQTSDSHRAMPEAQPTTEQEIERPAQTDDRQPTLTSEELTAENFRAAAASEQLAVEHYQEAAKYEALAENERRLAEEGGVDAQQHADAAREAEQKAELERQAAFEADQRADAEYQKAQQEVERIMQEPTPEREAQGEQATATAADANAQAKAAEDALTEEKNRSEAQQIAAKKKEAEKQRNDAIKDSTAIMKKTVSPLQDQLKTVEYQIGNVRAQLSTAKSALNVAGLTPTEKRQRTAAYNEVLARYNQLRSERKAATSAINAAINAHNQRVEQIKKG